MRKWSVMVWVAGTVATHAAAPFRVVDARFDATNQQVSLAWESALNQRFDVQRSVDLSAWDTVATNYPAEGSDGATTTFSETITSHAAFYRIIRPVTLPERPSILWIVVDDLRDHESFTGPNHVFMPNFDRLAARGVKFSRAYCQATFFNPSQASFLTGFRPDTTGISDNTVFFRDSANPLVANAVTLPQCFRANGYYTASLGKILHGTQKDPLSWVLQ